MKKLIAFVIISSLISPYFNPKVEAKSSSRFQDWFLQLQKGHYPSVKRTQRKPSTIKKTRRTFSQKFSRRFGSSAYNHLTRRTKTAKQPRSKYKMRNYSQTRKSQRRERTGIVDNTRNTFWQDDSLRITVSP